jgi:hypothetical protein
MAELRIRALQFTADTGVYISLGIRQRRPQLAKELLRTGSVVREGESFSARLLKISRSVAGANS